MINVSNVLEGFAQWLDDNGYAMYKPDEPYAASDHAVTLKRLPTKPDTAVSVTPYMVDDGTVLPTNTVRVQLRFRAGSDIDVDQWADEVAEALHWNHHFSMGNVQVQRAERVLAASLGLDDNGREERADSYELILLNQ